MTEVITQGLLGWLLRSRSPTASIDPRLGMFSLGFPWQYKAVVVGFVLLLSPFVLLGILVMSRELVPLLVYFMVMGPLFLFFLWAAYDAFLCRLAFSESGLVRQVWSREPLSVPWSLVASVEYSALSNHFLFRATGYPTIRVSIYRNGLATLDTVVSRALKHSPAGQAPYLLAEKAKNPV